MKSFELPSYDIARHVHVCVTGDGSVLLDVKRDKYMGLGRRETEWLARAVDAWPRPTWTPAAADAVKYEGTEEDSDESVWTLCGSLAEAGVLIRAEVGAAPRSRDAVPDMRKEWVSIGDELEVDSKLGLLHATRFVRAFGWARLSLAWRPFATVVEATRTRKTRYGRNIEAHDVLKVAALVGIFRRLRPFAFAAEGRCLLHALTLINFLAHYDFYPDWVIGVATQPWGAHSWVQWSNYLLDSNPEKICRFTPILVV